MLRFECDYGEGAAPAVLELLQKTNFDQTPGYGEDEYCAKLPRRSSAVRRSRRRRTLFVGATQANLTVIAAALKPWQGVLCADSGHIHVHETGSIEPQATSAWRCPAKTARSRPARSAKPWRSTAPTPATSTRSSPAWSTSRTPPRSAPFIIRRN